MSNRDYPFSGLAIRVWPYSGLACSGSLPFRSVCSGLSACQFVAAPMCPCSGLIASLRIPFELALIHSPTSYHPAIFGTIEPRSTPFRRIQSHTSFCQIRPRHLSFLPDYPAGTPHCVAPTCPAIFHTFRQHPDRRILPHSTPFPLTKTGDTEQSYPGRFDKRNRPQSRHFRATSHSQHGAIFPNRFIRKAPPGYAIMQKEVFPPMA